MDSGTESVVLLPMYPHGPGGGVGEVVACPGVLVGFGSETGPPLPGEVITRITATAAMIAPAVPMASHADRRLRQGRPPGRPLPRPAGRG
jgi:hypothetical protein